MKTKGFKHQLEALEKLKEKDRFALFLDMGLGKTWCALAHIEQNRLFPAIIVSPNNVKYVWQSEIQTHMSLRPEIAIAENGKLKLPPLRPQIIIVNYEFLRKSSNVEMLLNLHPKIVIFDESISIKNPFALQTKGAKRLGMSVKKCLLLSGMPITENQMDIFGQYWVLEPLIFGNSFYAFRSKYFVDIFKGKYDFPKWKFRYGVTASEFYQKVKSIAFIRKKEQCIDLPKKTYSFRLLEMSPTQKELYESIKNELLAEVADKKISINSNISKIMKLAQIVDGFVYDEDNNAVPIEDNILKIPKLKTLLDLFLEVKSRIVIWTRFVYDKKLIKKLQKYIPHRKIITIKSGDNINEKIKELPENGIIVIPIKMGLYGFTIKADTVVYFSNDWSLNARMQSEARTHGRLSLTNNVLYIDLIAKESVDQSIYNALKYKKNLSRTIFDKKALKNFLEGKI